MEKKDVGAAMIEAIDLLAMALADHGHVWSDDERRAYELAIDLLDENTMFETVH